MLFIFDTPGSFLKSLSNSHSYKCPFCNKSFNKVNMLYIHVDTFHKDEIPEGVSTKKYIYDLRHPGEHLCQICKINKCVWNEKTGRYSTLCDDPVCRAEARKRFMENYKKRHGKEHSINDPEVQREMLRHKKNSGYYEFQDGGKVFYASSFEKDFLEFCDQSLELSSSFIEECNLSFEYTYEGKRHFYLPDYYIRCYDLIIEIKADDDITHPKILAVDKETEKLKDEAIKKDGTHNFIKICDKKYDQFINLLNVLKNSHVDNKTKETDKYIVIPERKNEIRGFVMPKLNFVNSSETVFESGITKKIFKSCLDKNNKANISLIIDRNYIPTDYKDDQLFKNIETNEYNDFYKCKEYNINLTETNELKRVFNEFKNYYTKQCEHFINQNYLSTRVLLESRTIKFLDLPFIDDKKKNKFLELTVKYLNELEVEYAFIKKNLGYGIYLLHPELDKKEKQILTLVSVLNKKDFYTTQTEKCKINNLAVIPGSVDGGTNVIYLEEYSKIKGEEE